MRHDPANTNCDKVRYAGADDVLCTCDEDTPAPSTVLPPGAVLGSGSTAPTLSPRALSTLAEYRAAALDLDAARKMLAPAEARFRAALDAFTAALIA